MEGSYSNAECFTFDIIEEGRRDIFEWREKRRSMRTGLQGTMYKITKLFITRSLIRSFMYNLSVVVAFQMLLGAICTYSCVKLGLEMDAQMSLFVSPIVFPLAFSINANYQRRESVLEDLAMFKSSSSILFFCHRDWIKAAELPPDLLKTLSNKLKFLVINIREYLLTEDSKKRKFILQAIYEDLSDIAQLNDKIRTSSLKSNSALVARIIHCHNLMCLAFERLRVIREYNSPRSLRAFTKVFIFLMPLLLSPYYVFSGRQTESAWTPYYISVVVSFLYGSLQAVQDKLDDPFDGIGEDDVKLGQLDDWTTQSLLTNRTVRIGRFTVTTTTAQEEHSKNNTPVPPLQQSSNEEGSPKRTRHISLADVGSPKKLRRILSRKSERNPEGRRSTVIELDESKFTDQLEARCHGIASKLEGLSGTSIILPGNRVPYVFQEYQGLKSPEPLTSTFEASGNTLTVAGDSRQRNISRFRLDNQLAVVRESDGETSDAPSTPDTPPAVSEKLLSMKSDAVVRPGESSQKRPTVLGLFASPEGNTHTKVSNNVFTIPEEVSSPPTQDVFSPNSVDEVSSPHRTEISSPNSDEISPTTNSSEELLPLLSLNGSPTNGAEPESGSSIETSKTSSSIPEAQHRNELTPTTSQGGTSERIKGGTSEPGGVPKLRFCLPGKRGARGDGVRLWGRKHKKKRPPSKGKCESDLEPTGTNSMSLLLPHGTSQCSEIEEKPEFLEPNVSADVYSKDSDKAMDIGSADNRYANDGVAESESTGNGVTNNGNAQTGYSDHGRADFGSTDQKTAERNTTGLELTETDCTDTKPVNTITEEPNPRIVVNSPVEEESSNWDFDLSSGKPSGSNIGNSDTTQKGEGVTLPDDEIADTTRPQNVASSRPSIWDIASSENNVSPEPGGSRFSVSRNSDDSENTRNPKPSSSRFTVSPS